MLAQEIIYYIKKKKGKGGFFAIKIDLDKAYDRLIRNSSCQSSNAWGFILIFYGWIDSCISTLGVHLLLNENLFGSIPQSRELR